MKIFPSHSCPTLLSFFLNLSCKRFHKRRFSFFALTVFLALASSSAQATVAFSSLFGNNMILQRGVSVHVWGTANAAEPVTVSYNALTVTGVADSSGSWSVTFPSMSASTTGQSLAAQGPSNTVSFTNVVVGDVYLCSGQSNSWWQLYKSTSSDGLVSIGASEAATANNPNIRFRQIPLSVQPSPASDVPSGNWWTCVPSNSAATSQFSGLGYYFGKYLIQATSDTIPIGLLESDYYGMPAEAFISLEAIQADPALAPAIPSAWSGPTTWPTGVYNAMIAPLTPFNIAGVLWDQGESNEAIPPAFLPPSQYNLLLPALIKDWRKHWGANFPFFIIQLQNISSFSAPGVYNPWAGPTTCISQVGLADVRWGQFNTLKMPFTGMSVNFDLNPNALNSNASLSYHPPNKLDFAARIAPWAVSMVYGLSNPLTYTGPLYQSYSISGSNVILRFSFPNGGTGFSTSNGQPVTGFQISSTSSPTNFVWANAVTSSGDSITVTGPSITNPAVVRYAWSHNPVDPNGPVANLADSSGYLASPFQTYDFSDMFVTGTGGATIADMNLAPSLSDGTDFGGVGLCETTTQTFTILNDGSAGTTLSLTGGPNFVRITGENASDFTIVSQPSVSSLAPGANTMFQIQFHPGAVGIRRAILEIPCNTSEKTPYTIYLQATGADVCTPTHTPTGTWFTLTPTITPTVTLTPTVTNTPPPDTTLYNFEDGSIMGWNYFYNSVTTVAQNSVSMAYLGGRSLQFVCNFSGSNDAEVGTNSPLAPVSNLTGKIVFAHLWVPANFPPSIQADIFLKGTASYTWQSGALTTLIPGVWNTLILNPSSLPSSVISDVRQIGIQIMPVGSSLAVTCYLDSMDVVANLSPTATPTNTPTVTGTPTATPTVTPTPTGSWDTPTFTITPTPTLTPLPDNTVYPFEDGTIMNWNYFYNQAVSDQNSTVTAYLGGRSLAVSVNITNTGLDAEFGTESPVAAVTNLTGKTLVARLWVPADYPASSEAYMFIKSGSGWAWQTGPATVLIPGAWNTITLDPAQPFNVSGTPDISSIKGLGIQIFASAAWSGVVYVDSVDVLSSGVPTATPTPTLSPTMGASPTPTSTPTLSPTMSPSPTPTATSTTSTTPTSSASLTSTLSATPVFTATPSPTPTLSLSPTPTLTPTHTPTSTATPTPTHTPVFSYTPTPSPTATPVSVEDIPFPNPNDGLQPVAFYHTLEDAADKATLKIYTVAFRKVYERQYDAQYLAPGQHLFTFNWADSGQKLSDGLYYFVLIVETNGEETRKIIKVILRK